MSWPSAFPSWQNSSTALPDPHNLKHLQQSSLDHLSLLSPARVVSVLIKILYEIALSLEETQESNGFPKGQSQISNHLLPTQVRNYSTQSMEALCSPHTELPEDTIIVSVRVIPC